MTNLNYTMNETSVNGLEAWKVRIHWRLPKTRRSFQRQKVLVGSKTEVERQLKSVLRDWKLEYEDAQSQSPRWKDLIEQWSVALYKGHGLDHPVQKTTMDDHISILMNYTKAWNNWRVEQIGPMDVQNLFESMQAEGKSKHRCKALKTAINAIYDWATKYRIIDHRIVSPASTILFRKRELLKERQEYILSMNEQRKLLQETRTSHPDWYYVFAFLLLSGCRSGEAYQLQWTKVDFPRKTITVDGSFNKRLNKVKSTKTGRWRLIPMNKDMESLLRELKARNPESAYVLPRIDTWKRGSGANVLKSICKSLGIRECNLHGLRACAAVNLLQAGKPINQIMRFGGWTSFDSFQHYVRLSATEVAGATDGIDLLPVDNAGANVVNMFKN